MNPPKSPRASAAALVPLALLASACTHTFTEIQLREPARASFRRSQEASSTLLPEGSAPARAELWSGVFRSNADERVPVRLHLVRDADGSISSDTGRLRYLVRPTGELPSVPGELGSPDDARGPDLAVPVCASWQVRARASVLDATFDGCGDDTARLRYYPAPPTPLGYVSTPWSNVVTIRRREVRYGAGVAAGVIAVSGFVLAQLSILPFTIAEPGDSNYRASMAAGTAMLVVPAVAFALVAPFAFAPDKIRVVYAPASR